MSGEQVTNHLRDAPQISMHEGTPDVTKCHPPDENDSRDG